MNLSCTNLKLPTTHTVVGNNYNFTFIYWDFPGLAGC